MATAHMATARMATARIVTARIVIIRTTPTTRTCRHSRRLGSAAVAHGS